jgi:hypothetical protein
MYTDCIYESAAATISIHFSKKGAWDAMKSHKLENYTQWIRFGRDYRNSFKPDFAKAWFIQETEILP